MTIAAKHVLSVLLTNILIQSHTIVVTNIVHTVIIVVVNIVVVIVVVVAYICLISVHQFLHLHAVYHILVTITITIVDPSSLLDRLLVLQPYLISGGATQPIDFKRDEVAAAVSSLDA